MSKLKRICFILSIGLFLAFFFYSSYTRVTMVTKLPYKITAPGYYRLQQDFFYKGPNAINIAGNNVDLDLNGHAISGSREWNNVETGVYGTELKNVRIHNGIINGFTYGIRIDKDSSQNHFDHLQLLNNTFRGMCLSGSNMTISNNTIERTGGFRKFKNGFSFAIEVMGPRFIIKENRILETFQLNSGEGVGISLSDGCDGCIVEGNQLENTEYPLYGRTFGIWISYPKIKSLVIKNNSIKGYTYGLVDPYPHPLGLGLVFAENQYDAVDCLTHGTAHLQSAKIRNSITVSNPTTGCRDSFSYLRGFPEDIPDIRYRLALYYLWAGQKKKALEYFKRAGSHGVVEAGRYYQILTQQDTPKALVTDRH
jgi:hypothetical protein